MLIPLDRAVGCTPLQKRSELNVSGVVVLTYRLRRRSRCIPRSLSYFELGLMNVLLVLAPVVAVEEV